MGAESGAETPFSSPTAQILKKSVIPSLGKGLDASDVIECYALMRVAQLRPVPSRGTSGGMDGRRQRGSHLNRGTLEAIPSNSTGPSTSGSSSTRRVTVRKMALAFRYKPQANKDSRNPNDRGPFELTLEYGPQRAGVSMNSEAMPVVNNPGGGGVGMDDFEEEGKYMSWENEAKIYYETSLAAEQWTDAYYMAPITGAVLSNLLETAVEYPGLQPRYQPFEVVLHDTGKVLVRSSSSEDFVWAMFEQLAKLHVVMDPILTPPRHSIRLHVASEDDIKWLSPADVPSKDDPDADIPGAPVAESAAVFYENLYTCANAIRTGDYSMFATSTDAPSPSPTFLPTLSPSVSSTSEHVEGEDTGEGGEEQGEGEEEQGEDEGEGAAENGDDEINDQDQDEGDDGNQGEDEGDGEQGENEGEQGQEDDDQGQDQQGGVANDETNESEQKEQDNSGDEADDGDDSAEEETEESEDSGDGENQPSDQDEEESGEEAKNDGGRQLNSHRLKPPEKQRLLGKKKKSQESEPAEDELSSSDVTDLPTSAPSQPPSVAPTDDGNVDKAEAAAAAAEAAAQAAQEAKEAAASPEDSAAADAAEIAAHAAKKAAEATSSAAAQASMKNLFSGDGKLMTNVLSTCFSDPKYGIQKERSKPVDNAGSDTEFVVPYETVVTTYAYLFIDGANYCRVNLTAPYLDTAVRMAKIPKPQHSAEGHGEFIDWFLALTIIVLLIMGVLVLMGHLGLLTVTRCLRLRWFFKPHHNDGRGRHKRVMDSWDDEDDDDDDVNDMVLHFGNGTNADRKGGGHPHPFGMDAIPPSMAGDVNRGRTVDRVLGGLGSLGGMSQSPSGYRDNPQIDAGDSLGDVELMPPSSSQPKDRRNGYKNGSNSFRSSRGSVEEDLSFDLGGGLDDRIGTMKDLLANENGNDLRDKSASPSTRMMLPVPGEHRMNRDPDLVDLPNLKSHSKPAVPVSMAEGGL